MRDDELIQQWAGFFGLALAPLFGYEKTATGVHSVLLDGGYGSFAISVSDAELWREEQIAAWAWSSNLPHHVTVTDKVVAVTRWDRRQVDMLSRSSVERQIDTFYVYLTKDRVRSSSLVVDYVMSLFRRMRSLVAVAGIPDEHSVNAFLAFLGSIVQVQAKGSETGLQNRQVFVWDTGTDLLQSLPKNGIDALMESLNEHSGESLRLYPSLAIRHAGSEIFQEAHFEFLRTPGLDLFGLPGLAETKPISRGGAHFTPAPLARSVVEQTLLHIEGLELRTRLVVMDPACGSGAFLHEAVRTLRRMNFAGDLLLVGRDISAAAISMADFVIRHAIFDWSPQQQIQLDLKVGDSLGENLPQADMILMNPPFISWPALNGHQREQVRSMLAGRFQGRADLSMAFVTLAIEHLSAGGALGVLIPASLLSLQSAEKWRQDLLDQTDLRLLASLGEYGLFTYALVQVAAAVFAKPGALSRRSELTTALITGNSAESTGNALRSLRRNVVGRGKDQDHSWHLFNIPSAQFRKLPTWRLNSPKTENAIARLLDAGALRIGDVFDVRQGVRTGDNKSFLIGLEQLQSLPSRERKFFRSALMNDSIQDGKLRNLHWVFYPYAESGPYFKSEKELLAAVPQYANQFLLPHRTKLAARSSMTRSNREDWWSLSWERSSWALNPSPRLVSKYFGARGGFAVDLSASYIIVQGYGWFMKEPMEAREKDTSDLTGILHAYLALMNSRPFERVIELFSPHVAGGQYDLSPRYVDHILVPNLVGLSETERTGRLIAKLADLGREPRVADPEWTVWTDRITSELYGSDFLDGI